VINGEWERPCETIADLTTASKQAVDLGAKRAIRKIWRMQIRELQGGTGWGAKRAVVPWWRAYSP
jgi:hypothetical protein